MDEPDIYGDDIYSDAADFGADAIAAQPQQPVQSGAKAAAGGTATRAPSGGREAHLQAQLQQANAALEAWQHAFTSNGAAAAPVSPVAAAASLQKAREDATSAQTQLQAVQQRSAALEYALAEKNLESVQLRRSLHTARQTADPSIVQVRQLLLDPAVNREFGRLRAEVEEKGREVKHLQQELQAVAFSQESKTGRMLMAKCRTLQDENEEMGRELAEGKVAALERGAALAKGFGDDLRRAYAELEGHTQLLDRENEDLQGQVFQLRRQLRELEGGQDAARSAPHRPPPPPPPGISPGYAKPYQPDMSRKRPLPPDQRDMREGSFGDGRRRR